MPRIDTLGAYSFCPVCLSVKKKLYHRSSPLNGERALMIRVCISCGLFLLLYQGQGQISRSHFSINGCYGGISVSQTQLIIIIIIIIILS